MISSTPPPSLPSLPPPRMTMNTPPLVTLVFFSDWESLVLCAGCESACACGASPGCGAVAWSSHDSHSEQDAVITLHHLSLYCSCSCRSVIPHAFSLHKLQFTNRLFQSTAICVETLAFHLFQLFIVVSSLQPSHAHLAPNKYVNSQRQG